MIGDAQPQGRASKKGGCDVVMSEWEICRDFEQAKDRREQIKILADMNSCRRSEIVKVLERNGFKCKAAKETRGRKPAPTKKTQLKKRRERHQWSDEETTKLIELYKKGYYPADIAEEMKMEVRLITNKLSALTRKKKEADKRVRDVCIS